MTSLYQIKKDRSELFLMIEHGLGDGSMDEQQAVDIATHMDGVLKDKVLDIAAWRENILNVIDGLKLRKSALDDRIKSSEKLAERLESYIIESMESLSLLAAENELINITLKSNPESVIIDNESSISSEYWKEKTEIKRSIDKMAIKSAIKTGAVVDGAHIERKKRVIAN